MNVTLKMKKEDWEKLPGAEECSCNTGKVLYKCIEANCPNHLAQPKYCEGCMNIKHTHFPMKKIMTIIIETTESWPSFKQRYDTLAASAAASYKKVEPVIRYLETESIRVPAMLLTQKPVQRRNITTDYQKMQASLIELSGFMERVMKMKADGLIDQLDLAQRQFTQFQEVLVSTEYLADITDDVIYEALSDTIRENHSQPFVSFNQDHRDQYYRLKFRSFYSVQKAQHRPLPQEKLEENKSLVFESNEGAPIILILALE